ncbi:30S ribosomal protein S12 methylthiotransferase RimO [Seleniivibrio woodruffii]|uniref:30S ribosomal protein S12 methylthiotransferase RimO n=1 Tax=Seleniivibrio woodruffii TaxID=1078050 RepID=UPI002408FBB1|nr:30S ribosomal protein S12 methylthiotransferase RimO [Seleniivibrio woodruffii]
MKDKNKKISFISLGCSKNQVDLEYLMGSIKDEGYEITHVPEDSDAIVVNTCGFIEPAVAEAIENILEMSRRKQKDAKLIVTGCMSERYKLELLKEMPEIDYFTGVGELDKVIGFLNGTGERPKNYGTSRLIANTPYFAYLKISEGCNNKCSYCAIPGIRGQLVSRPSEDIIAEAENLVTQGVKEIIIISQDNTKYGTDIYGRKEIVPLLKKIENIEGDFTVRIMYMNPDGVDDELIDTICSSKKILSYFDIPVQHYSAKMLKAMKRRSTPEIIDEVFTAIRKKDPESFLRTTMIVGFPGETEADFDELIAFLKKHRPDFAGFFPYYREKGTAAYTMGQPVGKREVNRRIKVLQKLQKENTNTRLKSLKKNDIICYVEGESEESEFILQGRATFQAPEIDGKAFIIGGLADRGYGPYRCRIKKIAYPDIYCEITDNTW